MGKDQELIQAIRNNDVGQVKKLLLKFKSKSKKAHRKHTLHIIDSDGFEPLHHAALGGNGEIVMALLELTKDVNAKDKKGMTPLHLAAWAGKVEPALLLLDAGAQTNLCSRSGATPLHLASEHGNYVVVERLVDHDCDPTVVNNKGETALDLACRFGHLEVVRILLNNTRGKCDKLLNPKEFQEKDSPLHMAAKTGHFDVVRLLVEAGADINQKGPSGSCLHEAALFGKTDIVKYLIGAGIDVNVKNREGLTALDFVSRFTKSGVSSEIKHMLREASLEVVYAKAIKDYCNVNDPSFLTLHLGDIVLVLERRKDDMWRGCIRDDQKERIGYFPASAVKILRSPSRNSVVRSSTSSTEGPKLATVAPVSSSFEIVTVTPPTQPVAGGKSRPPKMSSFRKKPPVLRSVSQNERQTVPVENGADQEKRLSRPQSETDLEEKKRRLNYLDIVVVDKNQGGPQEMVPQPGGKGPPMSAPATKTEYADIWLPKNGDDVDGVSASNGKIVGFNQHDKVEQPKQQYEQPPRQHIAVNKQFQQQLQQQLQMKQLQQQHHQPLPKAIQPLSRTSNQKPLKPVASCPPLPIKTRHYTMSAISSNPKDVPPLPLKKRQSFSGRTSLSSPEEPTLPPKQKLRSSVRSDRRGTSPPPPPLPPPVSSSPSPVPSIDTPPVSTDSSPLKTSLSPVATRSASPIATNTSPIATKMSPIPSRTSSMASRTSSGTNSPITIANSRTLTVEAKWCPVLSPSPPPPPPPTTLATSPFSSTSTGNFPSPPMITPSPPPPPSSSPPLSSSTPTPSPPNLLPPPPPPPPSCLSPSTPPPPPPPPPSSTSPPPPNMPTPPPTVLCFTPPQASTVPLSTSPIPHEEFPPLPPSLVRPNTRTGKASEYARHSPLSSQHEDKCPLESVPGKESSSMQENPGLKVPATRLRAPTDIKSRGGYEDMNRLVRTWTNPSPKSGISEDKMGYVIVTPVKPQPVTPVEQKPEPARSVSPHSLAYENFVPLKTRHLLETEQPTSSDTAVALGAEEKTAAEKHDKPEKPERHQYVNCEVASVDRKSRDLSSESPSPVAFPVPKQQSAATTTDSKKQEYDALYDWLAQSKLLAYIDNFAEAGFDMATIPEMTSQDLSEIHISKTGHRKRLLSEAAKLPKPKLQPKNDVPSWLAHLGLAQYETHFMDGGFDDMEFLNDLTTEDLEAIGVTKIGHQRKLLMAVKRLQLRDSSPDGSNGDVIYVKSGTPSVGLQPELSCSVADDVDADHHGDSVAADPRRYVGGLVVPPQGSHYNEIRPILTASGSRTPTGSDSCGAWSCAASPETESESPRGSSSEELSRLWTTTTQTEPNYEQERAAEDAIAPRNSEHTRYIRDIVGEDSTPGTLHSDIKAEGFKEVTMNGSVATEDNVDGVKELAAQFQHTTKKPRVPPPVKPKSYKKPPPPVVAPKPKPNKHKIAVQPQDVNSTVDFSNVIKEAEALSESGSETSPTGTLARQHKLSSSGSLEGSLHTNTSGSQGSLNSETEDLQREIKESLKKPETNSVEDLTKTIEKTFSLSQEDLLEQQKREEELNKIHTDQNKTDELFTDIQGMLDDLNTELDDMFK